MNITKKLAISSTLIASLVLSPVAVFADGTGTPTATTSTSTTTEAAQTTEVGLTPDSFFYFFKQMMRDVHLYFANDDKEKAQMLLQYANEKAAELKVLNEAATTKYNEAQMKEIENMITEANTLIGGPDAVEMQSDVAIDPIPQPTSNTSEQPQDEATISAVQVLQVLKVVLDKLPEQDRKGVENAIKHLEKSIEKKQKKQHDEPKSETQAPAPTATEAAPATPAPATEPAASPSTEAAATATATADTAAQTPAPAPAPAAPATMPLNPEVKVQVKAPTTVITKQQNQNGQHHDHDDEQENEHKKEQKKENQHEKGNHENNQHGNHNGDN